jgi:hypothetical protein
MHDPLGNALMVEVENLLAEDEILEQGRTSLTCLEAVLVVGDPVPEIVGKTRAAAPFVIACDMLMGLAGISLVRFDRRLAASRLMVVEAVVSCGRGLRLLRHLGSSLAVSLPSQRRLCAQVS